MIESHRIGCITVVVPEETRTCIAVGGKAQVDDFIEPAPGLSATSCQRIGDCLTPSPPTITTGSFPRDSEESDIVKIVRRARELSDTLIVDTSGSALQQAAHLAAIDSVI